MRKLLGIGAAIIIFSLLMAYWPSSNEDGKCRARKDISMLQTIWRKPTYLPYLQPELTDSILENAHKRLGYKLPAEFIELLREQNGGYLRVHIPELPHSVISGIGPNFPSLLDFDWSEHQEYVSYPLKGLIPFDGDGHWYLCLDYRSNTESPSVTYVDVECDEQKSVAETFAGYLAKLELDLENEFVLELSETPEQLMDRLSKVLGFEVTPPDTWAHGYPIYRAALGDNDKPEWMWLSPNRVPKGFIRKDDLSYDQLKHHMQDQALRYPELPENVYIVSFTEGVADRVLAGLKDLGVNVTSIKQYFAASNQ